MLHSSELMPGGSARFDSSAKIEKLYEDIESVFEKSKNLGFTGATTSEYRRVFSKKL
jgi:hypothetical protein